LAEIVIWHVRERERERSTRDVDPSARCQYVIRQLLKQRDVWNHSTKTLQEHNDIRLYNNCSDV